MQVLLEFGDQGVPNVKIKKNKKAKQLRKEKRVFDTASVSSDSLKIKLS